MRVAFLTNINSMHINIKAKYFDEIDDKIYFFAMNCIDGSLDVSPSYKKNMQVFVYDFSYIPDWKLVLHNVYEMYKTIRKNNIQILHIIEMTFCEYAILLGLLGVKIVLENNGSDVLLASDSFILRKKYKYAYKFSKAVVQDSVNAQQAGIALGASKIFNEVIELGIDTDIFNPYLERGIFRRKYGIPDDAVVIFSARAFKPLYNIKTIIATIQPIVQEFPNTYYVFCSYHKNRKYQRMIEHSSKKVIFLGYLDNEKEMPQIYRDADIVISIPDSDSSPRTVYEAMACGSTVVVSDLPWLQGKLIDGKDVFAIQPKNPEKLRDIIRKIIKKEKVIDGEQSYNKVKKIMDYKESAIHLRELYNKIL